MMEPQFDSYGRMKYHPDFHPNHKKPWKIQDEKYLIENYEAIGPDEISTALGRTITVVMTRAYELRKAGKMKPRKPGSKLNKRIINTSRKDKNND